MTASIPTPFSQRLKIPSVVSFLWSFQRRTRRRNCASWLQCGGQGRVGCTAATKKVRGCRRDCEKALAISQVHRAPQVVRVRCWTSHWCTDLEFTDPRLDKVLTVRMVPVRGAVLRRPAQATRREVELRENVPRRLCLEDQRRRCAARFRYCMAAPPESQQASLAVLG